METGWDSSLPPEGARARRDHETNLFLALPKDPSEKSRFVSVSSSVAKAGAVGSVHEVPNIGLTEVSSISSGLSARVGKPSSKLLAKLELLAKLAKLLVRKPAASISPSSAACALFEMSKGGGGGVEMGKILTLKF